MFDATISEIHFSADLPQFSSPLRAYHTSATMPRECRLRPMPLSHDVKLVAIPECERPTGRNRS